MTLALALAVAVAAGVRGMWSPCGLSMLTTLNPVSLAARGVRFPATAGWYVAGALLGGALLGAGCAVLAAAVGVVGLGATVVAALAVAGALVCVVSDFGLTAWQLPVHPRQVNERWVTTYRRWIYAGGFGVQIGTGLATYVMTAGVYLTVLLAALTGDPASAALVGVVFGGVRGLTILAVAHVRDGGALRRTLALVEARADLSLQLVGVVLAVVAGGAAWTVHPLAAAPVAAVLLAVVLAGVLRGRAGAGDGNRTRTVSLGS